MLSFPRRRRAVLSGEAGLDSPSLQARSSGHTWGRVGQAETPDRTLSARPLCGFPTLGDGERGRMRVVITGGAGFIGANLARSMVGEGMEVVVVDDLSSGFLGNLDGADLEFHEGTILDPRLLDGVLPGADSVVHLAAIPSVPRSIGDPVASHQANATGTLQVLEAVRRADVPHVVVASSSSVYGANPAMPKREDMPTEPMSPVRGQQAGDRGVRRGLPPLLRPGRPAVPVLQRLRPAPGSRPRLRGSGPGVRRRRPLRAAAPRAR